MDERDKQGTSKVTKPRKTTTIKKNKEPVPTQQSESDSESGNEMERALENAIRKQQLEKRKEKEKEKEREAEREREKEKEKQREVLKSNCCEKCTKCVKETNDTMINICTVITNLQDLHNQITYKHGVDNTTMAKLGESIIYLENLKQKNIRKETDDLEILKMKFDQMEKNMETLISNKIESIISNSRDEARDLKNTIEKLNRTKQVKNTEPRTIKSRLGSRPRPPSRVEPENNNKEDGFVLVTRKTNKKQRSKKLIEKAKNETPELGYIVKNTGSKTSLELKKQAYSEILKNNPRPNIVMTNTIKRTGDIYIKPADRNTREALLKSNLEVVEQKTLKPKLLVYNVDSELTGVEVVEDLINLNSELRDTDKEKYNAINKRSPQGQISSRKVSWLLEVHPSIYKKLVNGRFYIGMSYCRILPYDQVTRCFICQRYGHIAKYCPTNIQTCMICSTQEKNHDWKNCSLNPKCVNCGKNEPSNHLDCPSRMRAIIQRCRKTSYGTNSS